MAKRRKKEEPVDLTALEGRLPPQNIEAEQNILGAMLIDGEVVSKVIEQLSEDDFYRGAHRKIFNVMVHLFQKDEAIDTVTVVDELNRRGELEDVGGAYYITELSALVPTSANIDQYIKIVRERALLRGVIKVCTSAIKKSYDLEEDPEKIIGELQQVLFELQTSTRQKGFRAISEVVTATIDEINERFQTKHLKTIGIPSGFDALDTITSGFQAGDLIILAGRPSMGKTAFALNLAKNAATMENVGVGIFSLEMSDMQLVQRLLCSVGMINLQNLRTGHLTEKEWQRLPNAAAVLEEAPIYIDDTPALDMNRLTARARRMVIEKGVGLIIVDYLQLMEAPRGFNSRQEEISYISRSLKGLAKNLNVPVIALSQLSRAVESRPDKRPTLADLRESGAIEQDADLVMFVFREEVYLQRDKDEARLREVENIAEIIIGKHRNGPIGTVKLTFLKQYGKFSDLPQADTYGPVPPGGNDVGF